MTARMVGVIVALCVITPALSQSRPTASAPSSTGQVGTIKGTDVYVRSGPGPTEYPCAKIHSPSTVTIVGKDGEWLEILPVPGTFSVISKKYVQADAAGATGVVTADQVFIHPAGTLRSSDFWKVHGNKLAKGDKVKIIGTTGDYYQIEPPPGANFYVSSTLVDLGGGTARVTPLKATTQTTGVVTVTKTTRWPASAPSAIPAGEMEAFKAVEAELKEQFAKGDADKIDVKGLMEKFLALNVTDTRLKAWVDYYVKYLQVMLDQKSNAALRDVMVKETQQRLSEIDEQLDKERKTKIGSLTPGITRYQARGILTPSGMYTGGATGPKKYVMLDPITKRVDSYVQCTAGTVRYGNDDKKIDDFVGKEIGVFGKVQYNRDLKLDVVEASEVIILNEKGEFPAPARPTISEPTVEPKTAGPIGTVKPVQPPTMPPPPATAETKTKPADVLPATIETVEPARPDMGDKGEVNVVPSLPSTTVPVPPVPPALPATPKAKPLPSTSAPSDIESAVEGG